MNSIQHFNTSNKIFIDSISMRHFGPISFPFMSKDFLHF